MDRSQVLWEGVSQPPCEGVRKDENALTAAEIRAAVLRRAQKESVQEEAEVTRVADQKSPPAGEPGNISKKGMEFRDRRLTGNYVRDFPEDFATSWDTTEGSSLFPKNHDSGDGTLPSAPIYTNSQVEEDTPSSMDESFPSEAWRLQPSLDRAFPEGRKNTMNDLERSKAMSDPYSTAPQGLQTSYEEECGGKITWPTFVKHYEGKAAEAEDNATTEQKPVPMQYMVLAYDPVTNSVHMAETRSSIPSFSPPLSPAEVLIGLSIPSQFIPYLKPLTEQGFEIVSGSGDVVVFRKTDASNTPIDFPAITPEARTPRPPRINPIDMMGSPVAGNFASPTGFVNYDELMPTTSKPAPPSQPTAQKTKEKIDTFWKRLEAIHGPLPWYNRSIPLILIRYMSGLIVLFFAIRWVERDRDRRARRAA
jgi:hypothetical protein